LVEAEQLSGSSSEMAIAILKQQSQPVLGTVGYMSPEQAQGKTKELNAAVLFITPPVKLNNNISPASVQ